MILLINPPFSYGELESKCSPLGLAYVASYLEKFGHRVKILDAAALELTNKEIYKKIKKIKPDIVGMTGVTLNFRQMIVKEICGEIKTIVGGPHASIMPESCLTDDVDYVVVGEGDHFQKID